MTEQLERVVSDVRRLPFQLPEFARIAWVTDRARAVWEPRLTQIANAWREVEWRSVASGARRACIVMLRPDEFVHFASRVVSQGLVVLPLQMQGLSNYSYAASVTQVVAGQPFVFRAVVAFPEDAARFRAAYERSDDVEMGKALGYPDCCTAAFLEDWVAAKSVDSTWYVALRGRHTRTPAGSVRVEGPAESNILLRWLGVRAVPHLPCTFQCQATVTFAQDLRAVASANGHASEAAWALEMLNWPVEWSALHGIAEIKTPVLKVSARTDATATKCVVERDGPAYPVEGATGTRFPFRAPPYSVRQSADRREIPLEPKPLAPHPWYATDNGFGTVAAMVASHATIIRACERLQVAKGDVLDLGCGNGALLRALRDACAQIVPWGIDKVLSRVEHARGVLPDWANNIVCGDCFVDDLLWPTERRFAIALLMPGRLIEVEPAVAHKLKERLRNAVDRIVVYAYGDWLERYGGLQYLCQVAGLEIVSPVDVSAEIGAAAAEARLI